MRIVFMGTPEFAVASLRRVAELHEVTLVVTRPDAVRGRGKTPEPSAVKQCACELTLPVLETNHINKAVREQIAEARPDVICVAAFGCILPDKLLAIPSLTTINVHASLLPRWRGAAPIQRAILAADVETGVSIMQVVHDLDAGAWCVQARTDVGEKTTEELTDELADLGSKALVEALDALASGTQVWHEQDEAQVTLAPKISKAEMRLDPRNSAQMCLRQIQASSDTAPARLCIAGRGARILSARRVEAELEAGAVAAEQNRVVLGTEQGSFEIMSIKPDGKRAMEAKAWMAGQHAQPLTWERI